MSVHVCVCVFAHVYVYVCIYVWACVLVHRYMCGCVHMCMFMCTHMCMYMSVCMCVWVCVSMSVCMCIHMFMCLFNFHSLVYFPSPSQFYFLFIWQQKSKLCVWLLREILGQWMFFSYCFWGCHHVTIESTLWFRICWCFSHVETIRGEVILLTFLRKDLVLQLLKQDTFPNSQWLLNNSKYL